jgi:hypothetical protein
MMTKIMTISMLPRHSYTEEEGALHETRNGSDLMSWKVMSSPCESGGGGKTDWGNARDRRNERPFQRLQFVTAVAVHAHVCVRVSYF